MSARFRPRRYQFTLIADSRFVDRGAGPADFAPYVPALNNHGVVAFQAAFGESSGVYSGDGGSIEIRFTVRRAEGSAVGSHPDLNDDDAFCVYQRCPDGAPGDVVYSRAGITRVIDERCGPLGPTIANGGAAAYRRETEKGAQQIIVYVLDDCHLVAETGDDFRTFHGIPVVNAWGAVAFRADRSDGAGGVYVVNGSRCRAVVETDGVIGTLGHFPSMNDAGHVVYAAVLEDGSSDAFAFDGRDTEPLLGHGSRFESVRGGLITGAGTVIIIATPRGGALGVFCGPDPEAHRILGIGSPLFGSVVTEFALNPVSVNDAGSIAVRLRMEDGAQMIVRADPD